jgi:hypothetical protein
VRDFRVPHGIFSDAIILLLSKKRPKEQVPPKGEPDFFPPKWRPQKSKKGGKDMSTWKCKFTLKDIPGFFEETIQANTSMDAQKIIERKYGTKTMSFNFDLIKF